jgi:hypothetical protein
MSKLTGHSQVGQYPEAIAVELHLAFPAYSVSVRRDSGEPRYELIAKDGRNPVVLISADPDEIRAELNGDI